MATVPESDLRLDLSMRASDHVWWEWYPESGRMVLESAGPCVLGYDLFDGVCHRDYWAERIHPEDAPRVMASLREHMEGKTAQWRVEHRFRARDGKWIWVEEFGEVRDRLETGEPGRVVGITRQVHDDHFLARLFGEADELLKGLCESLPVAFWLRDASGVVCLASAAAGERLPRLRRSLPEDIAADEAEAAEWAAVIRGAALGEGRRHLRRVRQNGGVVDLFLETRPLTGRSGAVNILEWIVPR
ncbi:MAG: PAS domain-containing protein [Opitutales bacterium]|nr:PAS domain-containing protein [Opitutales bacterium]